jgi:hypothetical protein
MAKIPVEDILKNVHPVFTARKDEWEEAERRLRGGRDIYDELAKFHWEEGTEKGATHYESRKRKANYVNMARRMAEKLVGHLSREAPMPGKGLFTGTLGDIRPMDERDGSPTKAELLWHSIDRPYAGQHWISFWDSAHINAMATGHRWIFCDTPAVTTLNRPLTRADDLTILRPYLSELSPLSVPDWGDNIGDYFRVVRKKRVVKANDSGQLEAKTKETNLLLVRAGFDGFGDEYIGGGWWDYDEELNLLDHKPWQNTGGLVPFWPFFYQRDPDEFSRSGLTAIGQISVSHMNIDSAGDNDAMEGGQRRQFIIGISGPDHAKVVKQIDEGSRLAGIPAQPDGRNPAMFDSAQVSAHEAIEKRLQRKEEYAAFIAMDELKAGTNASGLAREMEFWDVKSPRLAMMAREREDAENFGLRFMAMRWGDKPDGKTEWPKDFDIRPVVEDIKEIIDIASLAGVSSPDLMAALVIQAAKERGLMQALPEDVDEKMIREQLISSKDRDRQALDMLNNGQDDILET